MPRSVRYPKKRYVRYAKSIKSRTCTPHTMLDVAFDIVTAIRFKSSHHENGPCRRRTAKRVPRLTVEDVIAHGKGTVQSAQSTLCSWIDWTFELFSSQSIRMFAIGFLAGALML